MADYFPWALSEMAAAVAVLNRENIRSTRAGSALREAARVLQQPGPLPAEQLARLGIMPLDASGRLLPFTSIVRQFERADPNNRDLMLIFGVQAGSSVGALVRYGADVLSGLAAEVERSVDREFLIADTRRVLGLD